MPPQTIYYFAISVFIIIIIVMHFLASLGLFAFHIEGERRAASAFITAMMCASALYILNLTVKYYIWNNAEISLNKKLKSEYDYE